MKGGKIMEDFVNKEMLELIEDVKFACGNILERKHTKKLDNDEDDNDTKEEAKKKREIRDRNFEKIEIVGEYPEAGSRVEIYWKKSWGFDEPDYGYILSLPIAYEDEILIDGIIHIPNPQGGEKTAEEP